jgi:hypothetical protein
MKISKDKAIENVRELGRIFVVALKVVAKDPKSTSELMNGLVAYYQLEMKGQYDYLDESVDIVMNIIYENVLEQIEQDALETK